MQSQGCHLNFLVVDSELGCPGHLLGEPVFLIIGFTFLKLNAWLFDGKADCINALLSVLQKISVFKYEIKLTFSIKD